MEIPLNEFELHISETILYRGLTYYRNGFVVEPEELNPGEYEFTVRGRDDYTVNISLSNGVINDYACDCPYDMGPVCKHVAAVLFYMQEDELELNKPEKTSQGKKQQSTKDQVDELLKIIPHEELKQFIHQKTGDDRAFLNTFLGFFAHHNTNDSKRSYEKQVKAILRAASDRSGFIDWAASGYVAQEIDNMFDIAQKQVERNNPQTAVFISTAILEQLADALQYADDSDGSIAGCIDAAIEMLHQVAKEEPDDKIRGQLLDYCLSTFDQGVFSGWEWHLGILEVASVLVRTENELEWVFARIDQTELSDYESMLAQGLKYNMLLKIKGEGEANKYLEQYMGNPIFRRKALEKSINKKDYDNANKIAHAGITHDMEAKPGLAKEWYDWLLRIALAQRETKKIIEYARYLLIDNFRNDQDYYQILKDHVKPESWNGFIEAVITDISAKRRWIDTSLVANLYIKEKWWDRLLEMVKQNPDLSTVEIYEKHLAKNYAGELVQMYEAGILKHLENNVGRKHYQKASRYLRRMIKLGGRIQADRLINKIRADYPRRPALLEELSRI